MADPRAVKIAGVYGERVTVALAEELVKIAERLAADPYDLANLIWFESAWNPQAKNPSGAVGLLQWMQTSAAGLGLTQAQILALSAAQQLPLVEQYLAKVARSRGLSPLHKLAMAVFYPAAMDWPADQAFPVHVQRANKGIATPADYVAKLRKRARLPSTTAQAAKAAAVVYGRCWSRGNTAQGGFSGLLTDDAPCFPAKDLGANLPGADAYRANLVDVAIALQKVRDLVGPLSVGSGFRTPSHNVKVNGSSTSMHLKGLAADVTPSTMTNRELAALLYSMRGTLPFDQVIWYTNTGHVHLGLRNDAGQQRGQFLQATKDAGEFSGLGSAAAAAKKTKYVGWKPTAEEQDQAAQKLLALPHRAASTATLEEPAILPPLIT